VAAHGEIVESLWLSTFGTGYDRAYEGMQKQLALAMHPPTPLAHAVKAKLVRPVETGPASAAGRVATN
jgi:hypothetical protein